MAIEYLFFNSSRADQYDEKNLENVVIEPLLPYT